MTWRVADTELAVVVVLAYCLGSVPFALFMTRRAGARDLRRIGSGNIGATNAVRASGLTAGLLVALLDIAKGSASVVLARALSDQPTAPALAGAAAIVGHVYPVWLKFRGGKGVATTCGVFAVLTPFAVPPVLAVFALTVWLTKYISLGSVLASLCLPPAAYLMGGSAPVVAVASTACGLIVFRHRSNMVRLFNGGERRLGGRETAPRSVEG